MGYTHFQTKTLKRVGTEMALHVLAYNLKRVMNILGIGPLIAAMRAAKALVCFKLRPYRAKSPPVRKNAAHPHASAAQILKTRKPVATDHPNPQARHAEKRQAFLHGLGQQQTNGGAVRKVHSRR